MDACPAADPYEIQVYVNGWLARQMDQASIGYRRSDNKITAVDDLAAVAAVCERFAHSDSVLERQDSFTDQLQYDGRREGLGHATDPERARRVDRGRRTEL